MHSLAFADADPFAHFPNSSSTTRLSDQRIRQRRQVNTSWTPPVTMAPKKSTRGTDSINAKLALTIKVREEHSLQHLYSTDHRKVRQSHSRLQIHSQDSTLRQGEAYHHCRQHTTSTQVRARILQHACEDRRPPLLRQQRKHHPHTILFA
jgi:hypothetical protein